MRSGQRRAGSPARVEKNTGLADCRGETAAANAESGVTSYLFDYGPNKDGARPSGEISISDISGLPLRQEMVEPSPPQDTDLPVKITTEYSYGGDAGVPRHAERADYRRREQHVQCLMEMQKPGSNAARLLTGATAQSVSAAIRIAIFSVIPC